MYKMTCDPKINLLPIIHDLCNPFDPYMG